MAKDYRYLLQDLQRAEDRTRPKLNPDQKLSLCMIARNEEGYIGDALKSVQGLVDEIIVVDTGSADRTVEIAKENGAKVFFMEWQHDFAAARNEALKHATGDWVLILDADERVPDDLKDNLRSLLIPTDQPISYLLYIRNYLHEGDEGSVLGHYMVRLFRKTPETRFFGVIHEQLYPNWGEVTIPENSFFINHLGYSKQDKKVDKIENRNLPLILKALDETRGKNPALYSFYSFYMGSSLQNAGEVKKWLKESIDSCPDPRKAAHIPVAYLDYMRVMYYTRDFEPAMEIAKQALERVPEIENYPDFWDFYGILFLAVQNYDQAIEAFQKARKLVETKAEESIFFATHTSRIGSWGTLMNMGLAYALKGEQHTAQDYFRQSIEAYPSEDKTIVSRRIDEIMGNPQLTQAYFEERVAGDQRSEYDMKVLSNIYLKQEMPFEALMLQSELHGPEKTIQTALSLAQTYEQHQRFDLARKTYEGVLSLEPQHLAARLGQRGLELLENQQRPEPEELVQFERSCQTQADWQALGNFCLRFGLLEPAAEAFKQVLVDKPEDYDANLYLALVEQEQQNTDAAQERLRRLIKQAPEQLPAYTQLGNLSLFLGQFSEAEKLFSTALELNTAPDWYSFYALGVALSGQERFDEAEVELGKSLKLAPGHAAPNNLLALINQARQSAGQA